MAKKRKINYSYFIIAILVILFILITLLTNNGFLSFFSSLGEDSNGFFELGKDESSSTTSSGSGGAGIDKGVETGDQDSSISSSGSSGGGGGGGGSSGSGAGSGQNCEFIQINYFLINIIKNETCNQFNGTICEDKTVTCSVEVHNEDQSTPGNFDLELRFVESGKSREEAFDIKTTSFNVAPQDFKVFEDFTNIQSNGSTGLANKNINCLFNTLSVPQKQICT